MGNKNSVVEKFHTDPKFNERYRMYKWIRSKTKSPAWYVYFSVTGKIANKNLNEVNAYMHMGLNWR